MSKLKFEQALKPDLKSIYKRINMLEREVKTIKSWLTDDTMLSPNEKKLVDKTLRDIKTGGYKKLISHEELRKKLAV